MQNLFTWKFWFNNRPPALLPIFKSLLIGVTALFIVATFVLAQLKKKKGPYQKVWEELFNFSLTNSFISLIILFFNYEQAVFFSARFWLLIWLIEILVWLYFIIRQTKKIPERKQERAKEKEYKKYIP